MIHPSTELKFINSTIGYGVVATKFIPKGTITWVLDKLDREFSPAEFEQLDPPYRDILDIYCYRNNRGQYVLCWDNGRFINHSFNSNCLTTAYDFEIAIRDIYPGEQLTDDYGYLNINEPFRPIDEGTRRKVVYPDDLLKYYKVWDKKISKAIKKFSCVEQPLCHLIPLSTRNHVNQIIAGEDKLDSILNCYCGVFSENHSAAHSQVALV